MTIRILALICLLACLPAAQAQSESASPRVVQDEVSGFDYRAYRFDASAGQYYRVEIDNPDVDFSLLPVRRGAKAPEGAEGYIPEDGAYELRVLQKRNAAQSGQTSRFTLKLTVNNGQSAAADAASHATNVHFTGGRVSAQYSGRLQGQAQDSFRFFANAGQMLRVQAAGENLVVSVHYLGKGHENLQSDGLIVPAGGQYELRLALNRAAARRDKPVDYQVTLALEGRLPDSGVAAAPAASPLQPEAGDATPQSASAQVPEQPVPQGTDADFFMTYRCADGSSHKVHYADAGGETRATFYLNDVQYNLGLSKRHSTPAQAVLYGKGHYLVFNTPSVTRASRILQFFRRGDDGEAVLAADCSPQ